MSKSTLTLSKRQKMLKKRDQKLNSNSKVPKVIQVIDSEQQHFQDNKSTPIDKKNEQSGRNRKKSDNQDMKHNSFNLERLARYESSKKQKPISLLSFEIYDGAFEASQYQGRSLVSYKTTGNQSTRYISENHLKSRLQKISQQLEHIQAVQIQQNSVKNVEDDKSNHEIIQKAENKVDEAQQEEKKNKKIGGRPLRYFDIIPDKSLDSDANNASSQQKQKVVKCYRCGERGHLARNCHQQAEKVKCLFCLGDHHHSQCTDKLCFRCSKPGHVSQECKQNGLRCHRCKKVGHIERNCGSIILMDYSQNNDREIRQRYGEYNLKKIRCLSDCSNPKGHFNCFSYHSRPPKIYADIPRLK